MKRTGEHGHFRKREKEKQGEEGRGQEHWAGFSVLPGICRTWTTLEMGEDKEEIGSVDGSHLSVMENSGAGPWPPWELVVMGTPT